MTSAIILLQRDKSVKLRIGPEAKFLTEPPADYNDSLRTMSMTSLISEMHTLREVFDEANYDLSGSPVNQNSRKMHEQKEVSAEKLLAVELEIGRRVRAPKKQ